MCWTIISHGVYFVKLLEPAEQINYDLFKDAIRAGRHPREYCNHSGRDYRYKKLSGTTDQFEIRLSQSKRATFKVDKTKKTVQMLEVGGHAY